MDISQGLPREKTSEMEVAAAVTSAAPPLKLLTLPTLLTQWHICQKIFLERHGTVAIWRFWLWSKKEGEWSGVGDTP